MSVDPRPPRTACRVATVLLALLPAFAAAQGYAGLDAPAAGFAPVTAPADLSFPRDHGPHPGFRLEWWYVTPVCPEESASSPARTRTVHCSSWSCTAPQSSTNVSRYSPRIDA